VKQVPLNLTVVLIAPKAELLSGFFSKLGSLSNPALKGGFLLLELGL